MIGKSAAHDPPAIMAEAGGNSARADGHDSEPESEIVSTARLGQPSAGRLPAPKKAKGVLCGWHIRGVPPEVRRPFYVKGCPRCEEKRLAGLVTGNEPAPDDARQANKAVPNGVRVLRQYGMRCALAEIVLGAPGWWHATGVVRATTGEQLGERWFRFDARSRRWLFQAVPPKAAA